MPGETAGWICVGGQQPANLGGTRAALRLLKCMRLPRLDRCWIASGRLAAPASCVQPWLCCARLRLRQGRDGAGVPGHLGTPR